MHPGTKVSIAKQTALASGWSRAALEAGKNRKFFHHARLSRSGLCLYFSAKPPLSDECNVREAGRTGLQGPEQSSCAPEIAPEDVSEGNL
jgi:hypothetical protein